MTNSEQLIKNINKGINLTFEESKKIFLDIMSGNMKEELIFNFLKGLSIKGETSDEIAGGVYVLREKALKVNTSEDIVDTCGTGGDGKNTLNISTASALLLVIFPTIFLVLPNEIWQLEMIVLLYIQYHPLSLFFL